MDNYLGEIKLFAGTYAPRDWTFCFGQRMEISQYNALFALLGIQYGGDGTRYFCVPDLRGRVPVGIGQGHGLNYYHTGTMGGNEAKYIDIHELPSHKHFVHCGQAATSDSPENNVFALSSNGKAYAADLENAKLMNYEMVEKNTNNLFPVENRQPYLAMNYIICTSGLWPQRP